MAEVKVGDRYRLKHDVDRFPDFIMKAGKTGKVAEVTDYIITLQMDEYSPELEEWDNHLAWTDDEENGLPQGFLDDVEKLEA